MPKTPNSRWSKSLSLIGIFCFTEQMDAMSKPYSFNTMDSLSNNSIVSDSLSAGR